MADFAPNGHPPLGAAHCGVLSIIPHLHEKDQHQSCIINVRGSLLLKRALWAIRLDGLYPTTKGRGLYAERIVTTASCQDKPLIAH